MSQTLALESKHIAQELYNVIKTLESSKWRAEFDALQRRLRELSKRLKDTISSFEALDSVDNSLRLVGEHLERLYRLLEEAQPDAVLPNEKDKAAQFKASWRAYRKKLVPEYEALAASLKPHDIHIPSLRPTNYSRNFLHAMAGVGIIILIQHLMTPTQLAWLAGSAAFAGWTMEIARRSSEKVNGVLMGILGRFAHPHERYRINSSTWYTTALFVLAAFFGSMTCSLAVIVLGVSDPMAAIIGRKFGRRKLFAGRTLEGTLAFVVSGILAGLAVLAIFYSDTLSFGAMLLIASCAAIPGAIAELYSKRIDDNLSIPLAVAVGVTVAGLILGLSFPI